MDMVDIVVTVVVRIIQIIQTQLPWMLGLGAVFGLISFFSSQACNPDKVWWKSRDLKTDILYCFALDVMGPYLRILATVLIMLVVYGRVETEEVAAFFKDGEGFFAQSPVYVQLFVYLAGSDFILYWFHRMFHGRNLWPFHAVHHSPEDLDWTAMYRVHPVNRLFGPTLTLLILLGLGVPAWLMVALVPFEICMSAFVHSNLNWSLGPFKYVIATPVFHRWHHTGPNEGGESNFAPTFPVLDVIFGTFYMPEGKLPQEYGVDDPDFPKDFVGQMVMPFILSAKSFRRKPENPGAVSLPLAKE